VSGGRPPLGSAIVDHLEGPEEAKRRLKGILEVLSKEKTVETVCGELGIERARFYQLERQALSAAVEALEARPPGRPARPEPSQAELEVERLRKRIAELKLEANVAKVREEVATVMPYVLKDRREKKREGKKRPKPF